MVGEGREREGGGAPVHRDFYDLPDRSPEAEEEDIAPFAGDTQRQVRGPLGFPFCPRTVCLDRGILPQGRTCVSAHRCMTYHFMNALRMIISLQ